MYLKALEIQGFKSFPQKTRLTFEKPVTAIVGPNGSGKSNISDAIRWVMGEQSSKALRGGKMEDVIFGGTQTRGQMGFTEVSLILDNSAHVFEMENAEVMITRRYYRSGESEYYINRQAVRLKDVNELLMDTGLGRDGYSIIGQGRIDEILSVRSTDRRQIFEEAAGISRFRYRKEESERKLERAEENLLRVNDKISELEMQVEPLRTQSETAKKYLIFRDEMRGLEISVWTDKLEKLSGQSQKLQDDFAAAKAELETAQSELEKIYADNEAFSEKMRGKDVESESVREHISAAEAENAENDSATAVLRANLAHNQENIRRIDSEIKQQEGRDQGILAQIDERKNRIGAIGDENGAIEKEISSISAENDRLQKEAGKSSDALRLIMERDAANAESLSGERAVLSALAASMQELEDRSGQIISELGDAEERYEEAKKAAAANRRELEEAEEEAGSIRNVINGYSMRMDGKSRKAQLTEDKKIKLTMEQNAIRSRIALLAEMEKEYQGYSKSVKTVMQEAARGTLRGIRGPVADNLKTDDRFTIAIETALGGAMQDIIVDNEESGKAAINMLRHRDSGRATFLPVSVIKGTSLRENGLSGEPGFLGLAIDLVRYDREYEGIYTSLLGRIAVAEDMDKAIRIAGKYGHRFRIVTTDGQVLNAGGSMTGGSASRNAGILSRANELKKLAEHEKLIGEDLAKAAREAEEAKRELEAAQYELGVASEQLRPVEDRVLRLRSEKDHNLSILAALEDASDSLRTESGNIKARISKNVQDTKDSRARIAKYEQISEELKKQSGELSAGCEQFASAQQKLLDEIAGKRTRQASLEAERLTLARAVEELDALRRDLTGGRRQQSEFIDTIRKQNEDIEKQIREKERAMTSVSEKISSLKKRLSDIADEKMKMEAERSRKDRDAQDRNKALLELDRECSRLEQKKMASELEEKQIIDKLWDTYELSRTSAFEQRAVLEDIPAAWRRIGELKKEIARLGSPNLGAIEEFERVNTRYTYLSDQRDDIQKAKDELLDIIGDITGEMKDIFAREFISINDSFRQTFVELFGGGKAELELEDEDDILNCGIEIKVQPPGKSLKTLSLLSGGEKAFVAIALYFAIIKVRPTPFVVMDEIEAALDEANVLRFAEYLRRLTDKTQFLIITHRRGTMEEADVLYGVTMQEHGVSQVLNVDLDEAERAIGK